MLNNYLLSENPWKLEAPSEWWLQKLFDYDAQLVVFPSRMRPAHILARRRHFSNAMAEMNTLDKDLLRKSAGMDGDIMATHNLIYVRHLLGDTVKRLMIFQWLIDHDLQAQGGAEKVDDRIVSVEQDQAARARQKMIEDIDHRARDAYRSYQARTGRRSGYTKDRAGAKQMPITGFTPSESPLAAFVRD